MHILIAITTCLKSTFQAFLSFINLLPERMDHSPNQSEPARTSLNQPDQPEQSLNQIEPTGPASTSLSVCLIWSDLI